MSGGPWWASGVLLSVPKTPLVRLGSFLRRQDILIDQCPEVKPLAWGRGCDMMGAFLRTALEVFLDSFLAYIGSCFFGSVFASRSPAELGGLDGGPRKCKEFGSA